MLKVIIVDDDQQVGLCLKKLIPWDELNMTLAGIAYNGEEGFQLAIESAPDVIISDLVMPGVDGAEFCSRITNVMSDVSFIFLSAYEDFEAAQLAMKYHVRDYILKPIDRNKINYLIELLRGIGQAAGQKSFFRRILHDKSLAREIACALQNNRTDYFSDMFSRLAGCCSQPSLEPGAVRDVCWRLINIYFDACPDEADGGRYEQAASQMEQLRFTMDMLLFTSDLYFSALSPSSHSETAYYQSLCDQVRGYISEHYADPALSLSVIASAFNYSPDYLGRMFVQNTGDTVLTCITGCRVSQALRMLTQTTMSIRSIAQAVGYTGAGHLTQLIKKKTGMTPQEYRGAHGFAGKAE